MSLIIGEGAHGGLSLDNVVAVKSASDLSGVLDSNKVYVIDGVIDMGSQKIEVPPGGLNLRGYTFNVSRLTSSEAGYTMFTSPVGGSGDMLGIDYAIEVTGAGSKVYDLVSATGFDAFEFTRINYNNCSSLGEITNYRQGLESGTGRFGGKPELTLSGVWAGGYFIDTSIVRALSDGAYSLFSAGSGFTMASRFRSNSNIDLPASVSFLDFAPANFVNPSILQLQGVIIKRNGNVDANDTNITPNILASDLASSWSNNNGMPNTFVGGSLTNTSEVITNIVSQNIAVDLAGTFSDSELEHFDSPSNGRLRHLGDTPREFAVSFDFVVDGKDNDNYEVSLVKVDSLANVTIEYSQVRTINNLQGGRDVGYFNGVSNIILNRNDFVFWQITNLLDDDDCTLELGSQWNVKRR